MANIGTLLKQEISRLSRREARGATGAIKRATAQFRHDIAALKRKVSELERDLSHLGKSVSTRSNSASHEVPSKRARFVPKGLKSMRSRLGLSAADLGTLLGASAQSVYNWEQGVTKPRDSQFVKIAALRGLAKKEAQSRLEALSKPPARAAKSLRRASGKSK
jgi:DNA-binding transcriptional regulator YiaG